MVKMLCNLLFSFIFFCYNFKLTLTFWTNLDVFYVLLYKCIYSISTSKIYSYNNNKIIVYSFAICLYIVLYIIYFSDLETWIVYKIVINFKIIN